MIDRVAKIDPVETTRGGAPVGMATYLGSTRAIDCYRSRAVNSLLSR